MVCYVKRLNKWAKNLKEFLKHLKLNIVIWLYKFSIPQLTRREIIINKHNKTPQVMISTGESKTSSDVGHIEVHSNKW